MGLRALECCTCFLAEQHLSPTNSVARCQLTASCAQAVKTRQQGKESGSISVGQEEAAPSQKSAEEKVVQVKTGPSRYLAETSWRGTCEKEWQGPAATERAERASVGAGALSGQSPDGPEQQATDVAQGPKLAWVWVSAVCPVTGNRPVPTAPEPPIHLVPGA